MADYTIASAFPSGEYDGGSLVAEVQALGLTSTLIRIRDDGTTCSLDFDAEPTGADKTSLDAAIAAHQALQDLTSQKRQRCLEVDGRTVELISGGFTHAGKTFSLSLPAQSYWTNAYQARAIFTANGDYPIRVNTLDDSDAHDIADEAEMTTIYQTAVGTVKAHLGSGTAIKDQIRATTTQAELDAVTDTR